MSWNDLRKGRYCEPNREYFITFTCKNRRNLFLDHLAATTFCKLIKSNEQQYDCLWKTWVLMPDHFHGILQLGKNNLAQTIGHLKGLSAKNINSIFESTGAIWQPSYYDRALRAEDDRKHIARYIVANPLRAGLVKSIRHYPYWDSIYLSE